MKPESGYSSLRKGRFSYKNHYYHLIFSTKNRKPTFESFGNSRLFINILKEDQARQQSKTLAFVVMPDHVHWLMIVKKTDLSKTVKRIKSISSRCIAELHWSDGFYDHMIRSDENLRTVARYIVANPVRAGLVSSVRGYSHWDAIWL
jgi:putative transposase